MLVLASDQPTKRRFDLFRPVSCCGGSLQRSAARARARAPARVLFEVETGTPGIPAVFALAFVSNLFATLTPYVAA